MTSKNSPSYINKKISCEMRRYHIKADKLFLVFLWAHVPFAAYFLSYSFGTSTEGLIASLLVSLIGTVSYITSRGTLPHRILNGLLLMSCSIILITIQYGRIEMHFHVFATLPFLLVYKDWRVYPLSALLIAVQHAVFNYCQSNGVTIGNFPLIVFNYGSGWDIVFLHASFVVLQVCALIYFAKHLRTQYVSLMKSNEFLSETVDERTKDLTEEIERRKKTEQELKKQTENLNESNKELEQFAYVASHDLQEPLRMISSYLGLLEKRYKDRLDDRASDFIEFAVDGAQRMSKMITSLLEYSRVGKAQKSYSTVCLDEIIEKSLKNLEVRINESNAIIDTSTNFPAIHCDSELMERLFQNIIGNAIKFVPKDKTPHIKIDATKGHDKITISISDNGIGIPENSIGSVFQIFKRINNAADYEGTGIGLSICKKIVESHRGKIWVESELNKGTTFFIELPDSVQQSLHNRVA